MIHQWIGYPIFNPTGPIPGINDSNVVGLEFSRCLGYGFWALVADQCDQGTFQSRCCMSLWCWNQPELPMDQLYRRPVPMLKLKLLSASLS